MVTRKQLAALARGRAIRARKLKTKRTSKRRIRKITKLTIKENKPVANAITNGNEKATKFGFGKLIKNLMYGAGAFNALTSAITNFPKIKKGIRRWWSGNREIDYTKMREISNNIQRDIMMLGALDDALLRDFNELNRSINAAAYFKEAGDFDEEKEEIDIMLEVFNKIMDKYNGLTGGEQPK